MTREEIERATEATIRQWMAALEQQSAGVDAEVRNFAGNAAQFDAGVVWLPGGGAGLLMELAGTLRRAGDCNEKLAIAMRMTADAVESRAMLAMPLAAPPAGSLAN